MAAFDLDRFVAAQDGIHLQALAELEAGRKRSHWMWFVFPQLAGLGRSPTAVFYAIASAAEAVLARRGRSAEAMFGVVDAMKLKSSMTLFEAVAAHPSPFAAVLDAFFDGGRDLATLALLRG
jgi:uncharacterized protein (DUF1810 family)